MSMKQAGWRGRDPVPGVFKPWGNLKIEDLCEARPGAQIAITPTTHPYTQTEEGEHERNKKQNQSYSAGSDNTIT